MEVWEIDFEWLRVRHFIKDNLGAAQMPDLKGILFLIGLQEYGKWNNTREFSKEEKQDLMHVAVCCLLEKEGYYEYKGRDQDGWPHWDEGAPFKVKGSKEQEQILKKKIIEYFNEQYFN